jgi:hypothetical protein
MYVPGGGGAGGIHWADADIVIPKTAAAIPIDVFPKLPPVSICDYPRCTQRNLSDLGSIPILPWLFQSSPDHREDCMAPEAKLYLL